MVEIRQTAAYRKWFDGLRDVAARSRIAIRIRRLSLGNSGDVKPVGGGVSELRVDYDPATGSTSNNTALSSSSCLPAGTKGASPAT